MAGVQLAEALLLLLRPLLPHLTEVLAVVYVVLNPEQILCNIDMPRQQNCNRIIIFTAKVERE